MVRGAWAGHGGKCPSRCAYLFVLPGFRPLFFPGFLDQGALTEEMAEGIVGDNCEDFAKLG